ncbi:hypothetical protein NMY22_g9327 [Coprinellus aureogranulatus]|nr:hypothetical protein NMY22_g9327 [Coprinellus aureogranulatus]
MAHRNHQYFLEIWYNHSVGRSASGFWWQILLREREERRNAVGPGSAGLERLEQRPQVLETLHFKEDSRISCISTPAIHDRRCLRFAVVLFDDPNRIQLYEIGPLPDDHSFRLLAEMVAIKGSFLIPRSMRICDDLICFEYYPVQCGFDPVIVAWNFKRSLACSWKYGSALWGLSRRAPECVVISGVYILIGTHKIISWKIPPLQPLKRTSPISVHLQQVPLSSPALHDHPHDRNFVDVIGRYGSVMVNFIQPIVATADGSTVRGWLDAFYCVSDIPGNKKIARFYLDVAVDESSGDDVYRPRALISRNNPNMPRVPLKPS